LTEAAKSMNQEPEQEVVSVDTLLDSTLESVDLAEQMTMEAARQAGLSEDEQHEISMAVRETVVNAVVHGNRYSAHKKVHFRISTAPGRLTITVGDQGNGFDLSAVPDPLAEENLLHQSGRGLLLIRAFADDFSMRRRAEGGTEVRLVKQRKKHN